MFDLGRAVEAYEEWKQGNPRASAYEGFLAGYRIACEDKSAENIEALAETYADTVEGY